MAARAVVADSGRYVAWPRHGIDIYPVKWDKLIPTGARPGKPKAPEEDTITSVTTTMVSVEDLVARIRELKASGRTDAEIGRDLGLSTGRIGRIRAAHGIPVLKADGHPRVNTRRPRLSEAAAAARVDRIRDLKTAGWTDEKIGADLGLTKARIGQIRAAHGIPIPKPVDERLARIRELKAQGRSDPQIADALGLTVWTVSRLRRANGMRLPARPARADRVRQVRELNAEGSHDPVIAETLGLSLSYVWQIRKRAGIPAVPTGWPAAAELRPKIDDLARQGLPDAEIARRLGVSKTRVRRLRIRAGIPPGYVRVTADDVLPQVRQLAAEGRSDREIARTLGISRSFVLNVRQAHGVPTTRSRNRILHDRPSTTSGVAAKREA